MPTIRRLLLLPVAACLTLLACQGSEIASPHPTPRVSGLVTGAPGATADHADLQEFEVCKHGSSGLFKFTVDRRDNGPGVDSSGTFLLADGGCKVLATVGGL